MDNLEIKNRCLIISGGEKNELANPIIGDIINDDTFIICCDGAANYLRDLGINIDLIIGDFDSIDDNIKICETDDYDKESNLKINSDLKIECFDNYDVKMGYAIFDRDEDRRVDALIFKSEKDDTDTCLALKYAIYVGFKNIYLTCALGKRFDHTYANISLGAYAIKKGVTITIYSDDEIITFIGNINKDNINKDNINKDNINAKNINTENINTENTNTEKIKIDNMDVDETVHKRTFKKIPNYSFSIFSLTDTSKGVSISGAKYNVEDITLTNDFPLGISNEFVNDEIIVSIKLGVLCIIMSKIK